MRLEIILRFASTRILSRSSAFVRCERRVQSYFVCTSDRAPWTNLAGSKSGDNAVDVLSILLRSFCKRPESYHVKGVGTFADYYTHS